MKFLPWNLMQLEGGGSSSGDTGTGGGGAADENKDGAAGGDQDPFKDLTLDQMRERLVQTTKAREGYKTDLFKQKQKAQEVQKQLDDIKTAQKTAAEESARKNTDVAKLNELLTQERDELKARTEKVEKAYESGLRNGAIKEQALKLGVRPEALDDAMLLVESDTVVVEFGDKGNHTVHGAEEAVKAMLDTRPWLVGAGNKNLDGTAAGANRTDAGKTAMELAKMARENPEAYKAEIAKLRDKRKAGIK